MHSACLYCYVLVVDMAQLGMPGTLSHRQAWRSGPDRAAREVHVAVEAFGGIGGRAVAGRAAAASVKSAVGVQLSRRATMLSPLLL